jgi:hypothetical protein
VLFDFGSGEAGGEVLRTVHIAQQNLDGPAGLEEVGEQRGGQHGN